MRYALHVGTILTGFCNGHFGCTSYEDKRIEGIGEDWVVAREMESGAVVFASGANVIALSNLYRDAKIAEFEEHARMGGHMSECCQTTYNENPKAEICESCHCVLPEGVRQGQ